MKLNEKNFQYNLDMIAVKEINFDYHPSYYSAIYTKHGWKNIKTNEIVWEKVIIEPL